MIPRFMMEKKPSIVFVCASPFGGSTPPGLTLTPLVEWLALWRPRLSVGEAWAVDPFRLSD
jgi:hypothetical protein